MVDGQHSQGRLKATGTTEQMASHRLGRADDQLLGGLTKSQLDRFRFVLVAKRRRSTVGIHVVDLIRIQASIA